MEITVYFEKNLQRLRTARKLSQTELGKIVGKSHNAIYKWENGLTEPSLRDIFTLSYFFGVPVDVLLYKDITETSYLMSQK